MQRSETGRIPPVHRGFSPTALCPSIAAQVPTHVQRMGGGQVKRNRSCMYGRLQFGRFKVFLVSPQVRVWSHCRYRDANSKTHHADSLTHRCYKKLPLDETKLLHARLPRGDTSAADFLIKAIGKMQLPPTTLDINVRFMSPSVDVPCKRPKLIVLAVIYFESETSSSAQKMPRRDMKF